MPTLRRLLYPTAERAHTLGEQVQLQASNARSVKGRPIYTHGIRPEESARLWVLVIGGMYGDELSFAWVALHWIKLAQSAPAKTHWRFIPALNPDGLFNRPSHRVNANRVARRAGLFCEQA